MIICIFLLILCLIILFLTNKISIIYFFINITFYNKIEKIKLKNVLFIIIIINLIS